MKVKHLIEYLESLSASRPESLNWDIVVDVENQYEEAECRRVYNLEPGWLDGPYFARLMDLDEDAKLDQEVKENSLRITIE